MLRKFFAVLTLCCICLAGCSTDLNVTSKTNINPQTGQVTEEVDVGVTVHLGGQKPQFTSSGGNTNIQLLQEVPSNVFLDSSSSPQVTLNAQTDTGYTSSITVALTPTTTSAAPSNPADSMYEWYIADTPDIDAWQQDLLNNSNGSQIALAVSGITNYVAFGGSGSISIMSTISIPNVTSGSTTSSSAMLSGGGGKKCPNNPSCPVQPNEPPNE